MENNASAGISILKQVFDSYIEDSVTEEQVQRVLEPVFRLILQGTFDRPRRFFFIAGRKKM